MYKINKTFGIIDTNPTLQIIAADWIEEYYDDQYLALLLRKKQVLISKETDDYNYGFGYSYGNGTGNGYGNGFGNGLNNSSGNGLNNGSGSGYGDGSGNGYGDGSGNGYGYGNWF